MPLSTRSALSPFNFTGRSALGGFGPLAFAAVFSAGVFCFAQQDLHAAAGEGGQAQVVAVPALRELLSKAARDPKLGEERSALIRKARAAVEDGIVRRPQTLDELPDMRIRLGDRGSNINDLEIRRLFLMALYDSNSGSALYLELPTVAAAYSISGDKVFLKHVVEQMEELVTWDPLQRPGWTLGGGKGSLPEKGDGVWLATGWLIRSVADTLELLPPGSLPESLRKDIDAMLDREIVRIARDWREEIPWYVRSGRANTNQWVVPVEGLIRACLIRGVDRHRRDYELGVSAMLKSMDAQGERGEFTEGLTYAGITVRGMVSAARAMSANGDKRLVEHPFLRNTGTWFVHHLQPGDFMVNAFDALNAARGQNRIFGNLFAQVAVNTGSADMLWALQHWDMPGDSVDYLLARSLPAERLREPALWGYYPVGTRVVWRDSWDDDKAAGVWVRGGGDNDFHDHFDRGHVNFIIGNKALLIEAGRPPYSTPDGSRFSGLTGHNVLQIGLDSGPGGGAIKGLAPMKVVRMDAKGGEVVVDATACYPAAQRWLRRVTWSHDEVRVHDEVELRSADHIVFRWHLGEPDSAEVRRGNGVIDVGGVRLRHDVSLPVELEVASMPDATMKAKSIGDHACVVIRSQKPVTRWSGETIISLATR